MQILIHSMLIGNLKKLKMMDTMTFLTHVQNVVVV